MTALLKVPCTYQGGKQRLAKPIVDALISASTHPDSRFYDLCCGSGAISIELLNRGVPPERIVMLDSSSWGTFWSAIGSGRFRVDIFERYLSEIPTDKRKVKQHVTELVRGDSGANEAELYPILQACAFGGKQLWLDNGVWHQAFFRDYWEPTATSVRRSPANPMQPGPEELHRRIVRLASEMRGVVGLRADISTMLTKEIPDDSVVYIDPPYIGTTNYGFNFDIAGLVSQLQAHTKARLFISEGRPLSTDALELKLRGANGGISGNRANKHREWLSIF